MTIEATLFSQDSVVVQQSGVTVSSSSAGLGAFIETSDLLTTQTILPTSSAVYRDGLNTGHVSGNITSIYQGALQFDRPANTGSLDDPGDSGGSYSLDYGEKTFILGTQSSNKGSAALGTILSFQDISNITEILTENLSGNLADIEPTNLFVGSTSNDTVTGSFRSDVIIGRDGNDTLDGGDPASATRWGNDQLYGGNGDDILIAGLGNDLMHGGDRKLEGAAAGNLDSDGADRVDYGAIEDGPITSDDPEFGISIHLMKSGQAAPNTYSTFASDVDFQQAIFVVDLERDQGVDTLISIENITGSSLDDTLRIDGFDRARIAGADGVGGLALVNLGPQSGSEVQKGDIIDMSRCTVSVTANLKLTDPFICETGQEEETKLVVLGAERVIGGSANDILMGNGDGAVLQGGGGDDQIHLYNGDIGIGGAGADKFFLYTDRLGPEGPIEGDPLLINNALILGFDEDDELYVDGVLYTGFNETGTVNPNGLEKSRTGSFNNGEENSFSFSSLEEFDPNGSTTNALTGRLELVLDDGEEKHIRIDIADFQPGDGGIGFTLAYGFYVREDDGLVLQARQTDGLNMGEHILDESYEYRPEPAAFSTFDFSEWQNAIPTGIAQYDTLFGYLD